jgi:PIN domain nuclease of toxin-antitoxin system
LTGVVLDTHVLVWLLAGNRQIGAATRGLIDRELKESEVLASAISIWEIGVLINRGRLLLDRPLAAWRREARGLGVVEVPITGDIAQASTELTSFPRDPADRMIVATAMARNSVLVTADREILKVRGGPPSRNARE